MTEARGILLVVSLMATTALTLALGITDPAAPMSYPTKFLVWNLVLAWIPMVFAIAFDLVERRLRALNDCIEIVPRVAHVMMFEPGWDRVARRVAGWLARQGH